jgi:O-6-methylguanine DNA methyltransferase
MESQQALNYTVALGGSRAALEITVSPSGLLKKMEWRWDTGIQDQPDLAPPVVLWLAEVLPQYFASGRPMGDIPWHWIDESEWSVFQKQVYRSIANIPHGETRTYGGVAERVGNGFAGRAVGRALRSNPLPILIPCHRVVSVTSVGGFMGSIDPECSEIRLKQKLIQLEEEYLNPIFDFLKPGGSALL